MEEGGVGGGSWLLREAQEEVAGGDTCLRDEEGECRGLGGGGGEAVLLDRTGVRLPSLRVSCEERRLSRGEACHASRVFSFRRLRVPGVGGASAKPNPSPRRCSTGVWIPTERVLGVGEGVGAGEGGVLDALLRDEVEDRSPCRDRRRGNGDRAYCRNDAIGSRGRDTTRRSTLRGYGRHGRTRI